LDLLSLSILVAIVDSGNLSQAARALGMSRANVSYHLAQLEKTLGAELLRRTPQGMDLTPVGERVYYHARNIVHESAVVREVAKSSKDEMTGRVGLSAPTGYGQMVMGPWLIDFKQRYPGIVLDIRLENFIENLVRDGVDIALSVMTAPPPMLVARDLGLLRYVVCASRHWAEQNGMPQTLQALQGTPVMTSGGIAGKERLVASRDGKEEQVLLKPTLVSRNFPYLRECILAGLGVGIVPDYTVQHDVLAGTVVTSLRDCELTINRGHLYLLYMPGRFQSRATRTLIDFLIEKMGGTGPLPKIGED